MKHTMKHTIFHPAHVLLFSVFLLSKAIANKTISAVSLALYLSLALTSCGSGGGGGGSSQSSGASEKLSAALSAPSAPSGLTATVKSATEITLIWSATTNATFYEVYRGTSSNSANSTKKSDKTLTTTSYASTGLTPRTDYYYWLKACNSSGCSGFSTVAKATTPRAEFITTWKVEAGDLEITIPTNPDASLVYKYNVDCNDNGTDDVIDATGNATCPAYAKAGTYTVAISGDFPAIYFDRGGDKDKILTVENWGTINWKTMDRAFFGASNLTLPATDVPDLSGVSSMTNMFSQVIDFKGNNISGWDTSTITDMSLMFAGVTVFSGDISKWDVSKVTNMERMFTLSTFNTDISGWNVSSVTSLRNMFDSTTSFNQDISGWTVSKVTNCYNVFGSKLTRVISKENLDKIKSTTDGWLRSVENGGLPAGSGCITTISGL